MIFYHKNQSYKKFGFEIISQQISFLVQIKLYKNSKFLYLALILKLFQKKPIFLYKSKFINKKNQKFYIITKKPKILEKFQY